METRDLESSSSTRFEIEDGTRGNVDTMPTEDPSNGLTQPSLQIEDTDQGNMHELSEVHTEQSQRGDIINDESDIVNDIDLIEFKSYILVDMHIAIPGLTNSCSIYIYGFILLHE